MNNARAELEILELEDRIADHKENIAATNEAIAKMRAELGGSQDG